MSFWSYSGDRNESPSIALLETGAEYLWTMTLTNEEEVKRNAYLCLKDSEYAGIFWARVSGAAQWREIGMPGDPECYLGALPGGDTDIEFRALDSAGVISGYHAVQILLLHDDGVELPAFLFVGDWGDDCLCWASCWECAAPWLDEFPSAGLPVCGTPELGGGWPGGAEAEPGQWEDSLSPEQWA